MFRRKRRRATGASVEGHIHSGCLRIFGIWSVSMRTNTCVSMYTTDAGGTWRGQAWAWLCARRECARFVYGYRGYYASGTHVKGVVHPSIRSYGYVMVNDRSYRQVRSIDPVQSRSQRFSIYKRAARIYCRFRRVFCVLIIDGDCVSRIINVKSSKVYARKWSEAWLNLILSWL